MKKKSIFLWCLMAIIVASLLISCSNQGAAPSNSSETPSTTKTETPATSPPEPVSNVNPAGVFPIVKEKVTLKVLVNAKDKDLANNGFTKWLEEKTNVHIDWDYAPSSGVAEKLNLVLASGDYPDIIMNMGVNNQQQMIYGAQGVFIPLNDYIEEYGVEMKKAFEQHPIVKEGITLPDGNIYSIPMINECAHCKYQQKMWIYQPWLDKLGLSMPTTTDEFYNVLKAFKEQDPNGNGIADEIPLAGAASGVWNGTIDLFLMNAFVYNQTNRLYLKDGKIDAAFNKPEWKEGLAFMHKLYEDGLVAPETFTQNQSQLRRLADNPEPILGAVPSGSMQIFTTVPERWIEFVTVPPLKGPGGAQFAPFYEGSPLQNGKFIVTKASKHPEVAVRWADAFYEAETTLWEVVGAEGTDWRFEPENTKNLGINGKPAIWYRLTPAMVDNPNSWDQIAPTWRPAELFDGVVADSFPVEKILYDETKQKYEPYRSDVYKEIPVLYFDEQTSAELADLSTTIRQYVNEMLTRFTVGDADLEKDWDEYLSTLESMNLQRFLQIYQEAYDEKK